MQISMGYAQGMPLCFRYGQVIGQREWSRPCSTAYETIASLQTFPSVKSLPVALEQFGRRLPRKRRWQLEKKARRP